MAKYYTGVGSRSTPIEILDIMRRLAAALAGQGWTLRSGGAAGADSAFESGAASVNSKREIYLAKDATPEALAMASKIHPAWSRCSDYVRKLHARNCFQVLGRDLKTPSKFLVCWTENGADIGGTRTAIVLARNNGVQVFNLGIQADLDRVMKFV